MENVKTFEQRKKDHIRLALGPRTQNRVSNDFSRIGLVPEALPGLNFSEVDLKTQLLDHQFSSPHFISSMTAGHQQGYQINSLLAEAAAEKNWLFCVGSQKKELLGSSAQASDHNDLRLIARKFKKTKFVSNIGIEEVITYSSKEILRLVESINAIGIIVHLNALQEVFQNKKDVNMKNGLKAIEKLVKASPVPVMVKEVGFGISATTAKKLFNVGVSVVDVSGHGGTHWGMIEALRQDSNSHFVKSAEHFSDWGLSTVESLMDCKSLVKKKNIWASGGVRSGVDSAKCMALGAKAIGLAQPLLNSVIQDEKIQSVENVLATMDQFDFELKTALFCMGIGQVKQLTAASFSRKVWYEK